MACTMAGTSRRVETCMLVSTVIFGLQRGVVGDVNGVAPERQVLYQGTDDVFNCLDGSQTVPSAYVNDNYCDCKDGSDEPGTSACKGNIFYCNNAGHLALEIPSYRVNDGVCDCCDGSDETVTGVCQEKCFEAGRAWREEQALMKEMQAEGYAIRLANIAAAQSLATEREAKLAEILPEKQIVDTEVTELRELKRVADEPADAAKDVENKAWDVELESRKTASKTAIFALLDTNADDMISVKEVLARVDVFDTDEDGEVSETEVQDIFDQDSDGVLNETEAVFDFDRFVEELYEPHKSAFENEVPPVDENKPDYNEATKELIAAADAARDRLNEREPRLRELNKEAEDLNKKAEQDYGPDGAWAPYDGQCFSAVVSEYKYTLCPYGEAKQEPASGGGSTNLGNFKGFEGPEGNKYSKLVFDGGLKCWNGPSRSLTLEVKCGKEPMLSHVNEPSKCEYVGVFRIPSMCDEPDVNHDEL